MSRAKLHRLTPLSRPAVRKDVSALDDRSDAAGDSSLEQTLTILKTITFASGPPAIESSPPPPQEGAVKEHTSEEWRELERAEVQKRVTVFRRHQQRFQLEREAYCKSMLEKARTGT